MLTTPNWPKSRTAAMAKASVSDDAATRKFGWLSTLDARGPHHANPHPGTATGLPGASR